MKRTLLYFLFLALLLALCGVALSACTFSLAEDITPPPGNPQLTPPLATEAFKIVYPVVPPDPDQGAALFAENCAPCHGENGMGDGELADQLPVPVPALGDPAVARQATPAEWFTIVTLGRLDRSMPPFSSLSDRQRWDVVAYAFSLSSSAELVEQGKEIYQAECAVCHGQDGRGTLVGDKPSLNFTDQEAMAKRSAVDFYEAISSGSGAGMHSFDQRLNETQRWALTAYLRSFTFAVPGEMVQAQPTTEPASQKTAVEEPLPAPETASGEVIVQIQRSTEDLPLEGLPVTLYVFDDMQLTYTTTLTSQANGTATFENQVFLPERAFLAGVEYLDVLYGSNVGVAEDTSQPVRLTVTIYETTTDISALTVDRMHLFLDFISPDQVQVVELFIISNLTNKAVIASKDGRGGIPFALPEGATELEFQDGSLGERFIEIPGGFADTATIQPGASQYQVLFAYKLPYKRKLSLNLPMSLPVAEAMVFLPDIGVKVKSDHLQEMGKREVQGTSYLMFSGGNLSQGSSLTLDLSGRPRLGGQFFTLSDNRTNLLIGLGALGVTLILAGVWLYQRSRINESTADDEGAEDALEAEESPSLDDADTLMDAIIALDDLYQAGKLPEEAYLQRRAELKEKLKNFLSQRT